MYNWYKESVIPIMFTFESHEAFIIMPRHQKRICVFGKSFKQIYY